MPTAPSDDAATDGEAARDGAAARDDEASAACETTATTGGPVRAPSGTSAGGEPPPKPSLGYTIGWVLYDWANTGYAIIGLAMILPHFYKAYFAADLEPAQQTFWWGATITTGSLLVFALAPLLGDIAERTGARKRLLLRFAVMGMLACASLALVDEGLWWLASLIHVVAMIGFYCGNLFFDSMLDAVATRKTRNLVSGLGYSAAYLSGFSLVILSAVVSMAPETFGLHDATEAVKVLFVLAAVWWGVFSIPLALCCPERPKTDRPTLRVIVNEALAGVKRTFLEILKIPRVRYFLLAYLFYIDGVGTIITSASNLAATMGFSIQEVTIAFGLVQLFGVPFAIGFCVLANRIGAKAVLFIALAVYVCVALYGSQLDPEPLFEIPLGTDANGQPVTFAFLEMYVLACLIGMVQGGVGALSRSFFANIVPAEKSVAFFGFYSMIGKSAAVFGPILFGLSALIFNDPNDAVFSTRVGFGLIAVLFVIGGYFLAKVSPHDPPDTKAAGAP